MSAARWLAAALLVSAACSFDTGGIGPNDDASIPEVDASVDASGDASSADADPAIDATPGADGAPDAMGCTTECVSATELRDCDQGGAIVDCPLGCGGDVAEPDHCLELVPSNGASPDDLVGVSGALVLEEDELGTINTDTGQITINGAVIRDPGTGVGPEGINYVQVSNSVGLIAVSSLTMNRGSILIGTGDRALIVLSAGDVTITGGFVGVGAGCGPPDSVTCAGPGGGDGSSGPGDPANGCAPGGAGSGGGGGDESGGGGGGLGQAGAAGGDGTQASRPGGDGGDIGSCPGATAVPLVGGSGGGHGGGGNQVGGDGGGGGGALQISSYGTIAIDSAGMDTGVLYAGGAGGQDGGTSNGGGGGGSGGTILLEAATISIDGAVVANGGGGGDGISGGNGEFGLISTGPAQGGGNGPNSGGDGGSATATPTEGSGPIDGAGGGGGGAGIIRFNVPAAGLSLSATVSPTHTRGDPAVE